MSFFNFKNLAMTSSMTSSFPKSGGFVYSLLSMYTVSFKFVQALLLFKIAGEGSKGKKNTRKLDLEFLYKIRSSVGRYVMT